MSFKLPAPGRQAASFIASALLSLAPGAAIAATTVPPPAYHVIVASGSSANQFSVPGSYGLGGASAVIVSAPQTLVAGHVAGDPDLLSGMEASISYYFAVNGPLSDVVVPMRVTYALHAAAIGAPGVVANASAGFGLAYTFNGDIEIGLNADTTGPNPADVRDTHFFEMLSGRVALVSIGVTAGTDTGSADAYADPYFFVDPVFLANNPGYAVTVSAGIGNAAPVPEPRTYALLLSGLGLLGFVIHRRRRAGA